MHCVGFGSFDDDRGFLKAGVVNKATESSFSDFAFTQVVVSVNAGAEGFFAIVAVDDFYLIATDEAVKFGKCGFVGFFGADIVSGGKDVTGVETDCEVFGAAGELENLGKMLEFVVER